VQATERDVSALARQQMPCGVAREDRRDSQSRAGTDGHCASLELGAHVPDLDQLIRTQLRNASGSGGKIVDHEERAEPEFGSGPFDGEVEGRVR
jgi:hypothetical protein